MPKKSQKWMYFIIAGPNLGFSVAAGLLLGRYLDNKFGNEIPYFTVLGLVAGVVSGMTLLIRMLKMINGKK